MSTGPLPPGYPAPAYPPPPQPGQGSPSTTYAPAYPQQPYPAPGSPSSRPVPLGRRLRAAGRMVVDGVVVNRVREGRLRSDGWPPGWRVIMGIGFAGIGVALLLTITAPLWRLLPLVQVVQNSPILQPRSVLWVVQVLLIIVLALFHTSALHGPWWCKIITIVVVESQLVIWLVGTSLGTNLWTVLAVVGCVAVLAFSLVRAAFRLRWWEFVINLFLIAIPLIAADNAARTSVLGYDATATLLYQGVTGLAVLVVPAAVASGTAVAEVCVAAGVWLAAAAGRMARRSVLLAILAGLVVLRAIQVGVLVHDGIDLPTLIIAAVATGLLALVGLATVRRARRAAIGWAPLTELPEELSRIALPIGFGLLGVLLPFQVVLNGAVVVQATTGIVALGPWTSILSGDSVLLIGRVALVIVLAILAFRLSGRGRVGVSMLLGQVAVILLAVPLAIALRPPFGVSVDVDLINVFTTIAAVVTGLVLLARGRLTRQRIAGLGAVLTIGVVIGGRAIVLAPLQQLVGHTAPVLAFGLVWTGLTGFAFANRAGRRFPPAVRAGLALSNLLLTAVLLASTSLAGIPSQSYLDTGEDLGDAVLGTALLSATMVLLAVQLRADAAPVEAITPATG